MDLIIEGASGRKSRIYFGGLPSLAGSIDPSRTVIVTDPEIARLHGPSFPACPLALVERGEAAKGLASLEALYGRFLELGLGRDGRVLAVGGGAVSDLAGFAASTWLRGVDFAFAPTTLLAMVDASVGGKNGIDFRGVKNLIGSFSQPSFVLMDLALLATLPEAEFASGMAEAVKHAVLAGGAYLDLIESAAPGTGARRPGAEALERIVAGSVELKAGVVARDEREAGERRKLNLGHTIGHGVEAATGLPHGHSVAAGLGSACRLSARMGLLAAGDCDRIAFLLEAWGLPSSIGGAAAAAGTPDGPGLRKAIASAMASDKKRSGEEVLMALPRAPGSVDIVPVALDRLHSFVMEAP